MKPTNLFVAAAFIAGCSSAPPTGVRTAAAPPACSGGVVRSDAELQRYAGCRVVGGHLDLRGVSSLLPLHSLERVEGTFRIEQTDRLYSLAGLERLRSVDTLDLRDNASLISGGALRHLTHVRRTHLSNNPRLTKTYGILDALEKTCGDVYLSNNPGLSAEGVPESDVLAGAVATR